MTTYGQGNWGDMGWGSVAGDGPYCISSKPENGETNVVQLLEGGGYNRICALVGAAGGLDLSKVNISINAVPIVVDGVNIAPTSYDYIVIVVDPTSVQLCLRPNVLGSLFNPGQQVDVVIELYEVGSPSNPTLCVFSYTVDGVPGKVVNLKADTYCEGRRIDLSFSPPEGFRFCRILRSQVAYPRRVTDNADVIFDGAATSVMKFVDGVYPPPADDLETNPPTLEALDTTNTPLDPNRFYYYTVFYSDDGVNWSTDENAQVEGLSIKEYTKLYGDYVYALLPLTYRERDARAEGKDKFNLKRFCRVLQCAVNLYRGWIEATLKIRNPDEAPAGLMGEARDQNTILSTISRDLDMDPELSFDSATLRRIALGLMAVYRLKGTCPGLTGLIKLLTQWDSTCEELIEPNCGVFPFLTTWDGVSGINYPAVAWALGEYTLTTAGRIDVTTNPFDIPVAAIPNVTFVIDAMGTYACVSSADNAVVKNSANNFRINFENALAKLRAEIVGTVEATILGANTVLFSTDMGSYPWQYPSSGGNQAPLFGENAWKGYKVIDSTGTKYTVVSSVATDPITLKTLLVLSGNITIGTAAISLDFDGVSYAARQPRFFMKVYDGSHSMLYDPKWDIRLKGKKGPWSVLVGGGGGGKNSLSVSDVILWIDNSTAIAPELGETTAVTYNTLTDASLAMVPSAYRNYYLNPNRDQAKMFRVIDNTDNTFTLSVPDGGLTVVSAEVGSHYFLLSEDDAYAYTRLMKLLPKFLPHESRAFVYFEEE